MFNFVALDFETANSSRASACSIGLVKFENGSVTESFSRVFLPPKGFDHFDPWNIRIHGIEKKEAAKGGRFADHWPEISDFISGFPIVAHNASFDLSVLRNTLSADNLPWPNLNYICTMVLSRQHFDLPSNSLSFAAHAANVGWSPTEHHEAGYDATKAGEILVSIYNALPVSSMSELLKKLGVTLGSLDFRSWTPCGKKNSKPNGNWEGVVQHKASEFEVNVLANEDNPIYAKHICFTGALHSMSRPEAMAAIAALGAYPQDSVTKSTDILVLGEQDLVRLRPGAEQSSKFLKAQALREKGQNIEVMTERDFLGFIEIDTSFLS
jgi:DNA polymerase-3 subunit epsilon